MSARRGTILVLVAGVCALMASLTIAYLMRMRSDAEESRLFEQEVQARTMLTAALQYVLETSRLGWRADPAEPDTREAYGWIDVRDGGVGPKDALHRPLFAGDPATGVGADFPAVGGRAARCPMHVLRQPPCAVEMTVDYNPLPAVPTGDWRKDISYANAEPRPVADASLPTDERFRRWLGGDPTPLALSTGLSWFRCYRMTPADCAAHVDVTGAPAPLHWTPAVFVVTCGAGGTQGYRDWDEVVADGATDAFAGDRALFADLRAHECVRWYACEWHPAVACQGIFLYEDPQWRRAAVGVPVLYSHFNQQTYKSFGGSFLWIERLAQPPAAW